MAQQEWRERRVAQIMRDFMEAYELSSQIGRALESDELDFQRVRRLVGDSEESALYRLKEECHALFRFDQERSESEIQAEELFDLAVGALFHEAMRFREGYYLTTRYAPRLESQRERGPLVAAFLNVIRSGHTRMRESGAEMLTLFEQTRDQLVILLKEMSESGVIARSLLEDSERAARVFDCSTTELMREIFGDADRAARLAVENLIAFGHYQEADEMVERVATTEPFGSNARAFAIAMDRYFAGEPSAALDGLETWVERDTRRPDLWTQQARRILDLMLENGYEPSLGSRAEALIAELG